MKKPLVIVFMNNYAEECAKNYLIQECIKEQVGTDDFTIYSNMLLDVPAKLAKYMTDDFFHGVATAQLKEMEKGGVFINPLLAAISIDFDTWSSVIASNTDELRTIRTVEIPYDLYLECTNFEDRVTEEIYDENTASIAALTVALNETRPDGVMIH